MKVRSDIPLIGLLILGIIILFWMNLLFGDVRMNTEDVFNLLKYDKDIVCGAYPMKGIPLRYNYTFSEPREEEGELIKIETIGFGFCLIKRKV